MLFCVTWTSERGLYVSLIKCDHLVDKLSCPYEGLFSLNLTSPQFPNYTHTVMSVDLFWTVIHKAVNRDEKRPLELLSLVFGAAAFIVSTRLLKFGTTQGESTNSDIVADEGLPVSDTA